MPGFSNRSRLHGRLSTFVDWIATAPETEEAIRRQADEVRSRIRGQANDDGLTVRSTPNGGSYAKRTGLRRHLQGDSEVEGQDIDLPFVISPKTHDDEDVDKLVDRFERYAKASYPNTSRERSKCSVKLNFVGTGLAFDLVPVLATNVPDEQILFRDGGERRRTSIQKHIEFVTSRTRKSNELPGRVKFNECVRLLKWWREFRVAGANSLTALPSFTLELLAAKAFDQQSVAATYGETLARWFGFLADLVQRKAPVTFSDFGKAPTPPATGWAVIDPVNADNNVVASWSGLKIGELATWLSDGRDEWARALGADIRGDDASSMAALVEIFGAPLRHHSGD